MVIDIDVKTILSGLGFCISIFSLYMAVSAKKEAHETALLDLVHKKRMLVSDNFSEVCRVVRLLKDEKFENDEDSKVYTSLRDYRNRMIEAMNESSEMLVDIKGLKKKTLLNEISDFNLLHAINESNLIDLQFYLDKKS